MRRSIGALFAAMAIYLLGGVLYAPPAPAGESGWIETQGGRIRVVTGNVQDDGSLRAMIDIALQPGWKTYWRDPGDAGIPPQFDLSADGSFTSATIHFPPPRRIDDGHSVWAGYTEPVRLPLLLKQDGSAGDGKLQASLFLGICEQICIPVQADIAMPIADPADRLHAAMVDQAFARLPQDPTADFVVEEVSVAKREGAEVVVFEARVPEEVADEVALFAVAPDRWRLGVPQRGSTVGGLSEFIVPILARPMDASRQAFDVVLTSPLFAIGQSVSLH